jgi:Flp pilus assembly secretin CpaC
MTDESTIETWGVDHAQSGPDNAPERFVFVAEKPRRTGGPIGQPGDLPGPENLSVDCLLDGGQRRTFYQLLNKNAKAKVVRVPRLTLADGQEATMQAGDLSVTVRPVIAAGNVTSVRIKASCPSRNVSLDTTVSVPEGRTALLHAGFRISEGRNTFSPPLLGKIPLLSRLVTNVGYGRETETNLVLLTPRVTGGK